MGCCCAVSNGIAGHQCSNVGKADGSMQFASATAKAYGIDPMDDSQAIPAAGKLWADNLKATGGDIEKAAKYYVAGQDESKWGPQTHAYPGKLLAALQRHAQADGPVGTDR